MDLYTIAPAAETPGKKGGGFNDHYCIAGYFKGSLFRYFALISNVKEGYLISDLSSLPFFKVKSRHFVMLCTKIPWYDFLIAMWGPL